MLLYERITFLLVIGTFGLFVLAFLMGAWGIALTFNPRLNAIVLERITQAISYAAALYDRLRVKYDSLLRGHIPVRS